MSTSEKNVIETPIETQGPNRSGSIEHVRSLDGFQQVMLRWEEIRPYNAVHAVELNGLSLCPKRLAKSAAAVFHAVGLTSVRFNHSKNKAEYTSNGNPLDIVEIDLSSASIETISELMTDKLSDRFSTTEDLPFRMALATEIHADKVSATQYLVIGYRHAIADAQSIVLLLKAILDHYHDGNFTNERLTCNVEGLRQIFSRDTNWRTLLPRLRKLSVELVQGLWCSRPVAHNTNSPLKTTKVHRDCLETSTLKAAARNHHASIQDFLMAAQAEAIAEVFEESPSHRLVKGNRLAVTSMIDLRRYANGQLDHAIGQFLGMLAIRPTVRSTSNFSSLIESVKAQNDRSKQRREFFWAINSMHLMARIWDVMPLSINRDLGRFLYPFVCALSNVNLGAPIFQEIETGLITNYFRGANLGVLVPLVLSNTTVGSHMNLCTTHKDAVYSDHEVDQFIDCICRRIRQSA